MTTEITEVFLRFAVAESTEFYVKLPCYGDLFDRSAFITIYCSKAFAYLAEYDAH